MKRFNTLHELAELLEKEEKRLETTLQEIEVSSEEHRAYFDILTKGTIYAYILENIENKPLTFKGTVLKINENI